MKFRRYAAAGLAAAVLAGFVGMTSVNATHQPADKVAASGSVAAVVSPASEVVLLSEQLRTSSPSDLILGVTLECVVTTELTTRNDEPAQAEGIVRVWVEVDGTPVPVSDSDDGKVNFCDRMQRREMTNFDDNDATIKTLDRVGVAAGFNWLKLNTGNGIHLVEVKADLQTNVQGAATALAAVGKRTLVIEPVKSANDETLTDL